MRAPTRSNLAGGDKERKSHSHHTERGTHTHTSTRLPPELMILGFATSVIPSWQRSRTTVKGLIEIERRSKNDDH